MIKSLSGIIVILFLGNMAVAQNHYEILEERKGEKSLKGILSREAIELDSTFKWFASNQQGYTPHSLAISALRQHGDSIQIIAFLGTWCEDSHFVIPKFLAMLDASGFPKNHLTLVGVDRSKKTLGNLSAALNVQNVPTLIVMKNGTELGRVVEYGKYGMWDKELGEVVMTGAKSQ